MRSIPTSSSSSHLLGYNYRPTFLAADNPQEIRFFRVQKLRDSFPYSFSLTFRSVSPVSSSSSQPELELEYEETELPPVQYEPRKVQVKLQLQKECLFGEHFFVVGDDPILGSWDPENAVPMNWSDGHLWTAELDIPIGKSIEFKFILKEKSGDILWQPGPNRSLQIWETHNIISDLEDWEDAEVQQLMEEERIPELSGGSSAQSEMLLVADNLSEPINESLQNPMVDSNNKRITVDSNVVLYDETTRVVSDDTVQPNMYEVHDQSVERQNEANSAEHSSTYPSEELMSIVADNISTQNEVALETSDNEVSEKTAGGIMEEDPGNKDARIDENKVTLGEEHIVVNEDLPVLVPGLTPPSTMPTEDSNLEGARMGGEDEAGNARESDQEEEGKELAQKEATKFMINNENAHQDPTEAGLNDIEADDDEPEHDLHSSEDESNAAEEGIVENDIKWGQKTLQKLLNNLRLI